MTNPFITIEQAMDVLKMGRMIILMDDEHRENEGDLVLAADYVTPEAINFMSRFGRGLICLSLAQEHINRLQLPMMTTRNRSPFQTAFTVSIEAASGVSTGISASDRAHTISVAIDPKSGPNDIISPGHIFPLKARPKGVLERPGQTEGSVDLVSMAGLTSAAVICEITNEDGSMSRRDDLIQFSKKHDIPIVLIRDLIQYRIRHETLVEEQSSTRLPLPVHGDFTMKVFKNQLDTAEHFVLVKEPKHGNQVPLVRIHSECITGDVFGSCKCDCGDQLQQSLHLLSDKGGILVYLRQEGRGIGLSNKIKAYALQDQGLDTVDANIELGLPADNRGYGIAWQILKYLGVEVLELLTNNPAKVSSLEDYGMVVSKRIPLEVGVTRENLQYLKTKKEKMGHWLELESPEVQ